MSVLALAFFALGAVVASFIGVIVARLNTGQSYLVGRSRCDACGEPLSFVSLVPVLSYLSSGGRARCCGAQLAPSALISELLLGTCFVGAYAALGVVPALPALLLSLALLQALVLYDLAHQILPPWLLGAFIVASSVTGWLAALSVPLFLDTVPTALVLALALALIHAVSRGRAMGLSDAPLVFGLSLLVGSAALPGFVFSFWIGAVIGIFILAGRPSGSRMGVEVPFAPFLAAGFLLAYFTQWNPFAYIAAFP